MKYCIFNASLDTGNLGVSALGMSCIYGLGTRFPGANITVFDHSTGLRAGDLSGIRFSMLGATRTRRVYRAESHAAIEFALRTRIRLNTSATRIAESDSILDISGGDSFTDLYGSRRFSSVLWPKLIALRLGKPLVLLPQTYGPFRLASHRAIAERVLRGAAMAWARDERSFESLCELVGSDFDAQRHRSGVDVAFLLPCRMPELHLTSHHLRKWLEDDYGREPLAGVNISGLIYNDVDGAKSRFGFIADYRHLIHRVVRGLVDRGARVMLVPHVLTPPGHYESDVDAAIAVQASLPSSARDRVATCAVAADPREVKWLIGRCDWFCGTRMHATIAGLSQGIPTAAVAYSLKTAGVFETCGQGEHVVDPRTQDSESSITCLLESFERRRLTKLSLERSLTQVMRRAEDQMNAIAAQCLGTAAKRAG